MKLFPLTLVLIISFVHHSFSQSTLISQFDFDGNMNDLLGNSNCSSYNLLDANYNNGIYSWTGDTLSNGGGLTISIPDAAFTEENYSIEVIFKFSEVNGYRKVIDFKNQSEDYGLYFNNQVRIYSSGNYGTTNLYGDTTYTLLFVRDGSDSTLYAYLQLGDTLSMESLGHDDYNDTFIPALIGGNRVFNFFMDDSSTISEFSRFVSVDRIRIWNGIADLSALLGTEEIQGSTTTVNIFPNPADHFLNIQFEEEQQGILEITDLTGKLVYQSALPPTRNTQLDISSFTQGVYILNINGYRKPFIKK